MIALLATIPIIGPAIFGGWAAGSAYRWWSAPDDEPDRPGPWSYIALGFVGVALLLASAGFAIRYSGLARRGGFLQTLAVGTSRILETVVLGVRDLSLALISPVFGLLHSLLNPIGLGTLIPKMLRG